jgi:hypothetical protein
MEFAFEAGTNEKDRVSGLVYGVTVLAFSDCAGSRIFQESWVAEFARVFEQER